MTQSRVTANLRELELSGRFVNDDGQEKLWNNGDIDRVITLFNATFNLSLLTVKTPNTDLFNYFNQYTFCLPL